ncbi:hypothetical protein YB2330_005691 [Saitoella coloradoensis]
MTTAHPQPHSNRSNHARNRHDPASLRITTTGLKNPASSRPLPPLPSNSAPVVPRVGEQRSPVEVERPRTAIGLGLRMESEGSGGARVIDIANEEKGGRSSEESASGGESGSTSPRVELRPQTPFGSDRFFDAFETHSVSETSIDIDVDDAVPPLHLATRYPTLKAVDLRGTRWWTRLTAPIVPLHANSPAQSPTPDSSDILEPPRRPGLRKKGSMAVLVSRLRSFTTSSSASASSSHELAQREREVSATPSISSLTSEMERERVWREKDGGRESVDTVDTLATSISCMSLAVMVGEEGDTFDDEPLSSPPPSAGLKIGSAFGSGARRVPQSPGLGGRMTFEEAMRAGEGLLEGVRVEEIKSRAGVVEGLEVGAGRGSVYEEGMGVLAMGRLRDLWELENGRVIETKFDLPEEANVKELGVDEVEVGKEEDAEKKRKIMYEIVETERTYVSGLQQLVDLYILSPPSSSAPPLSERRTAFSNLAPLCELHQKHVLPSLEAAENEKEIARAFRGFVPFFRMYHLYLASFSDAAERIQAWGVSHAAWLGKIRKDSRHRQLDLMAYLVLPVQRPPRYLLLLQELAKASGSAEGEVREAMKDVTGLVEGMNERRREAEGKRRLWEMQDMGIGEGFEWVLPARSLVREGEWELKTRLRPVGGEEVCREVEVGRVVRVVVCSDVVVVLGGEGGRVEKVLRRGECAVTGVWEGERRGGWRIVHWKDGEVLYFGQDEQGKEKECEEWIAAMEKADWNLR